MNSSHFNEWFETKLLPNCPPNSVIVLDNVPYHNFVIEKIPTKLSRKSDMQEWLTQHKIPWDNYDLKKDFSRKFRLRSLPKNLL